MYHDRVNLTISALASAPGSSIGIIRVSGTDAFKISTEISGKTSFEHMKASLVKIKNSHGKIIEQCLCLPFFGPHSFTGEDVVEFHTHGATKNAKDILQLINESGAVPALKGEFSFRAVLNNKMSLNEGLSLNTLISAENPLSVELSRKVSFEDTFVEELQNQLKEWEHFHILSTAVVDFPDQMNSEIDSEKLKNAGEKLKSLLVSVVENSQSYQKMLDFTVLILGRPNVGKSTLFNYLLKKNRAIISSDEGTTRDYISETLFIKGFPLKLVDSAGIRNSCSNIEAEGVKRSRFLLQNADLLLVVLDSSLPLQKGDHQILKETSGKPRIVLYNKADLNFDAEKHNRLNFLKISSKTGDGITLLLEQIEAFVSNNLPDTNRAVFFSDWQMATANKIIENIDTLQNIADTDQIEITSLVIKNIFSDVSNLSGKISTFNLYDEIFSSFCLGK